MVAGETTVAIEDAARETPRPPRLSPPHARLLDAFTAADFDLTAPIGAGASIADLVAWYCDPGVRAHLDALDELAAESLRLRAARAAPTAIAVLEQIAAGSLDNATERRRAATEILRTARRPHRPTNAHAARDSRPGLRPETVISDGSAQAPPSRPPEAAPSVNGHAAPPPSAAPPISPEPSLLPDEDEGERDLTHGPHMRTGPTASVGVLPCAPVASSPDSPTPKPLTDAALPAPPTPADSVLVSIPIEVILQIILDPEDDDALDELPDHLAPGATLFGRPIPTDPEDLWADSPLVPLANPAPITAHHAEPISFTGSAAHFRLTFTHDTGPPSHISLHLTRDKAFWLISAIDEPSASGP